MRFIDDKDIAAVQASVSQVAKDSIGQIAAVLVPAIANATKGVLGSVSFTVGPITIEPIKITVDVGSGGQG